MPELKIARTEHGHFTKGHAAAGPGRPRKRRLEWPAPTGIDWGYGLDGGGVLQRLGQLGGVPDLSDDELTAAHRAAAASLSVHIEAAGILLAEFTRLSLELSRRDPLAEHPTIRLRRVARAVPTVLNQAVRQGFGRATAPAFLPGTQAGAKQDLGEALGLPVHGVDDAYGLAMAMLQDGAEGGGEDGEAEHPPEPDDGLPTVLDADLADTLIRMGALAPAITEDNTEDTTAKEVVHD